MGTSEVHNFDMAESRAQTFLTPTGVRLYMVEEPEIPTVDEIFKAHEVARKIDSALGNETPEVGEALAEATTTWVEQTTGWRQAALDERKYPRDNRAAVRRGRETQLEDDKNALAAPRPILLRPLAIQEGIVEWEHELFDAQELDAESDRDEHVVYSSDGEDWLYFEDESEILPWDEDPWELEKRLMEEALEDAEAYYSYYDDDGIDGINPAEQAFWAESEQDIAWDAHEAEADATRAHEAAEAEADGRAEFAAFNGDARDEDIQATAARIGKWVVSTDHSWRERTRDSIGTLEQRDEIKKEEYAAARAERRRLAKRGQRRPRPAPDGYLPGKTPQKHNPWNMAVAQSVLLEEHGLVLEDGDGLVSASSRQASLLTENQTQTIHKAWDAHESETKTSAAQAIDEMFAKRAEQETQERIADYSVGMAEAAAFNGTESSSLFERTRQKTRIKPKVVRMREHQALKARRNYENRVSFDGYDASDAVDDRDVLAEAA